MPYLSTLDPPRLLTFFQDGMAPSVVLNSPTGNDELLVCCDMDASAEAQDTLPGEALVNGLTFGEDLQGGKSLSST